MNRSRFLKHRNSQKRIYRKGAVYFLTIVTQNRFTYFREKIFCDVFRENLYLCRELKGFELFGWFLGYDHFHLLIGPGDRWSYSEVMRSLKTSVSCDINRIMTPIEESGVPTHRFLEIYEKRPHFFGWKEGFHQKYPNPYDNPYPKFKWLGSFHDHVIQNQRDFDNHLGYIQYNVEKHSMPDDWEYMEILT